MSGEGADVFHFATLPNGWIVGTFPALNDLAGVGHVVTTRHGPQATPSPQGRWPAAEELAAITGAAHMAFCRQVHGGDVIEVKLPGPAGPGDGLVTKVASLGLMGFSADCPLILAADPVGRAVGIAHASWRATVRRIASTLVAELAGQFNAEPSDVTACICPSAGPCCYEVGSDVLAAALEGIGPHAGRFLARRHGKTYFDLRAANADQLVRAGLRADHVHVADVCTICRNDLFPSYRVEGPSAGRFLAAIALKCPIPEGQNGVDSIGEYW